MTHVSLRGSIAFTGHKPKFPTDDMTGPASLLAYVGVGAGHGGSLRTRAFGRALSLSIDRGSFRFVGVGGPVRPAVDPIPEDLGGQAPTAAQLRSRRDAARRELRRAVLSRPALASVASGEAVVSILVDRSRPDDVDIAQKVLRGLDRIGVRARVDPVSPGELRRRVGEGRCDLYIGQLATASRSKTVVERIVASIEARDGAPLVPLFHRGLRVHHRRSLFGLRFDAVGGLSMADAFHTGP